MKSTIQTEFTEHLEVTQNCLSALADSLEATARLCIEALQQDRKLLIFGNGGSAADAQHIAAELVGRYQLQRKGLAAIALTTDTSALTSIGNDFGFEQLFARQVEALARPSDVLIGISTSGNSTNVINALTLGKQMGCKTVGFSGQYGGAMKTLCDITLAIPSTHTPRIQEMHILLGHTLCHLIEQSPNI
jgi:D-sedoheptulose 7-phosphate isomerase